MTLPSLSVRVTTVLLKEVLMYALPETMFFFVLRRRERPPAGFPCAFAIESSPYRATCADYLTSHAEAHNLYPVSYTHLRAHETDSYLVCRLLLEKKKKKKH